MREHRISIASDFSRTPGGLYAVDGTYSGETFREEVLWPAIQSIPANYDHITVILDDAVGYPSSFLEEAFGGLVRVHNLSAQRLLTIMDVEANNPHFDTYRRLAERYIRDADERRAAATA
jgi:hypothetical protein